MGLKWPRTPGQINDGDDHAFAPEKSKESLLGTQRGTDYTRRLETNANRDLYVSVADSEVSSLILTSGSIVGLADSILTTICTFVITDQKLTRISCSGTGPADFVFVVNASQQDIKRSDTQDLDKEFVFNPPLALNTNDVVEVKVFHHAPGKLKSFDSTVYGA